MRSLALVSVSPDIQISTHIFERVFPMQILAFVAVAHADPEADAKGSNHVMLGVEQLKGKSNKEKKFPHTC